MATDQPATVSTPIGAKRLAVLRALADLAEQHNLPLPQSIFFNAGERLELRLGEDDRAGVHAWTDAMNNGEVWDMPVPTGPFTSVRSDSSRVDRPAWQDLGGVSVWAVCDRKAGGEQS